MIPMNAEQVKARLIEKYPGSKIEVTDLTGTEDHYKVHIEGSDFAGLTRLQTHRQIMDVFQTELQSGEIHAFTISTTNIKI